MKTLKRISALLLAVLLIAGFSITAFADEVIIDPAFDSRAGGAVDDGGTTASGTAGASGTQTIPDNYDTSDPPVVNVAEGQTMNNNYGFIDTNNGTVKNNTSFYDEDGNLHGRIETNNGSIGKNDGTCEVGTNNGTIDINNGMLGTNSSTGLVKENTEYIEDNNGTVKYNMITVDNNNSGGIIGVEGNKDYGNSGEVKNNSGTVFYNISDGVVVNNDDGGVVKNNIDKGSVVNNNDGGLVVNNNDESTVVNNNPGGTVQNNNSTVINNNGTVVNNNGTVVNSFPNATIGSGNDPLHYFKFFAEITVEGSEADYKEPTGELVNYDGKYWLEDKDDPSGSVTVYLYENFDELDSYAENPADVDYKVSKTDNEYEFDRGSTWIITFTRLVNNIKLKLNSKAPVEPEPVEPEPPAPVVPIPAPQPTYPMYAATYTLTFELDGGVMPDGETKLEMECSAGQRIKLPEAPEKDGCTFAGWQTEVRGKTVVFDAGTRYIVNASKTFTALWE